MQSVSLPPVCLMSTMNIRVPACYMHCLLLEICPVLFSCSSTSTECSVAESFHAMQQSCMEAFRLLIAHALDLSTSSLLLEAKTPCYIVDYHTHQTYSSLQEQSPCFACLHTFLPLSFHPAFGVLSNAGPFASCASLLASYMAAQHSNSG